MPIPENIPLFKQSLDHEAPPVNWPESLKAMWWDSKGDWVRSHDIAQEIYSDIGNWIHAYLHRKEGDKWNAGYWYRRAGKNFPNMSLEEENDQILRYILGS